MEITFSLSSTAGTNNPSLLILTEKGYCVAVNCYTSKKGTRCVYIAEKDHRRFAGDSGAELLGLATLWEHFGEDWNRFEPDVLGAVMKLDTEEE